MGQSSSLAEVGAKIERVNDALTGRSLRRITERVGARSKPVAAKAVEPASLGRWGRGRKRGGYKVAARYKVKTDSVVAIQPTVPPLAALLEEGSYKAGTTWKAPKRRGSKRRKKGTVGTYTHARVPARKAWSKALPPVQEKAPRFVDEEVQRILREIF